MRASMEFLAPLKLPLLILRSEGDVEDATAADGPKQLLPAATACPLVMETEAEAPQLSSQQEEASSAGSVT